MHAELRCASLRVDYTVASRPNLFFLMFSAFMASVGAMTPPQLADLQLQGCHGRYFFDGGSNTGDSVRSFLSGAPWPPPPRAPTSGGVR